MERQRLNINFTNITKLTPAGRKTIMPITVGGKQIIPKELIKPAKSTVIKPAKRKPKPKAVKKLKPKK